ncbi:MAG: hypothetical protein CMJ78_04225 [Planctomycetaceae bacterium]|nr:hypothetical protein [Planctomycetaceae bacterium]
MSEVTRTSRYTLPPEVRKAEWKYIFRRRQAADVEDQNSPTPDETSADANAVEVQFDEHGFPKDMNVDVQVDTIGTKFPVGIGISGGGIRSATLNLGVLQTFAESGVFRHIDLMSTVSGGGYLGSCLSSLLTIPEDSALYASDAESAKKPEQGNYHAACMTVSETSDPYAPHWGAKEKFDVGNRFPLSETTQMHHLRKHGDFLILRSGILHRDVLRVAGAILSGLICTLLTYFVTIAFLSAILMWISSCLAGTNMWAFLPEMTHEKLPEMIACIDCEILAWFAGIGAVASAGFDVFFLAITKRVKPHSFWPGHTGETRENHGERAWIQAYTVWAILCFVLLAYTFLPALANAERVVTGLLSPLLFSAGILVGEILAYCVIATFESCVRRSIWVPRNRSIWEASIGVGIYSVVVSLACSLFLVLFVAFKGHQGAAYADIAAMFTSLVTGRFLGNHSQKSSGGSESDNTLDWLKGIAITIGLGGSVLLFIVSSTFFVVGIFALPSKIPICSDWISKVAMDPMYFFFVTGVVFVVLGYLIDFNRVSLHYFYRDRLAAAYLQTESFVPDDGLRVMRNDYDLKLQDLHKRHLPEGETDNPAPYHLIVTALNLAGSRDLARKDCKSDHFIFSREFCGSTTTGYVKTDHYAGGQLRLANAMTISGAAASPGMGANTSFHVAFAAVLFNIRLGQWLENPRIAEMDGRQAYFPAIGGDRRRPPASDLPSGFNELLSKFFSRFWPLYLFWEATSWTTDRRSMVNLSDGGHTGDNLGLYPLFQRRCRLIIACDGECDPAYHCSSLSNVIR